MNLVRSLLVVVAVCPGSALPVSAQLPRLDLVTTIGCEQCGGPSELGVVLDVAVDDSGGVLIIDNAPPFLRRFDRSGRALWATGQAGGGPGEYQRALWAFPAASGVQVVDMGARRVLRLDSAGSYRTTTALRGFPAAVAAEGRTGAFVVLIDDFRGNYRLERWTPHDTGSAHFALPAAESPRPPGTITFAALAATRGGSIAFVRDINDYRIQVLGANGALERTITRDIARVRRTPEEIAAQERVAARASERVRRERGAGGRPAQLRPANDADLKPHIAIDGLQYDDAGRLWVRTMRGNQDTTIIDVFSPVGVFLGELRVPGIVGAFALAGPWLALATETEDGYPVVQIFRVS